MNRFYGMAILLAAVVFSVAGDRADACFHLRRCRCEVKCPCRCECPCCRHEKQECKDGVCPNSKSVKGNAKFWPFTDGEDPAPEPYNPSPNQPDGPEPPKPTPAPDPRPSPEPGPDPNVTPIPDPTPLPPEPPAPTPQSVLPTDHSELNAFIAKKLGGYAKANTNRDGCPIDIWQSRGKQKIAWAVERNDCWRTAVIEALIAKSASRSDAGGIVLVCHCPNDPTPVNPEPTPAPVPLPAPEPTPVQKRLVKFGGEELVTAEAVCRAAGLWLVVVHDKTGDVHRVIYGTVIPKPVAKWKAPNKK